MRAFTAKGFKKCGFELLIGDGVLYTVPVFQKPAQIICRGPLLWHGSRLLCKRTQADGFSFQNLPPQDLFDYRFLRRR